MIIYKATNLQTGKVYIGQTTKTLDKRKRSHYAEARQKRKSRIFVKAIRKYGEDSFSWKIIDRAKSVDEMNEKEIYWISHYKATERSFGYNLKIGGNGGPCPEETKRKLSIANKGQVPWTKGRTMTYAHRLKISKGQPSRQIDEDGVKKVKYFIHIGLKSVEIASRLNISVNVVYNIKTSKVWKHVPWPVGYKNKHGIQTTTEAQAIEIKKLLCDGVRNLKIVEKVGVSEHIVSSIRLNKTWRNIPWPGEIPKKSKRGGSMNINAVINEKTASLIKQAIVDGMRQCDIMRKFSVTKSIVYSIRTNTSWKEIPWPSDHIKKN